MAPINGLATALLASSQLFLGSEVQNSGAFNVLSYNVAGLPQFINSNGVHGSKFTNTAAIGTKFAEYDFDVVQVQEDFGYHATLYDFDESHPYRTETSGNIPFGSGLNTLSNFNFTDFQRITWAHCYIGDGDCLTPKGFTFMRMTISDGVTADFYNLHGDAGDGAKDEAARRSNIQQLADFIDEHSAGQAVLVFGDTNTRYTRVNDNIRLLGEQSGLKDAWVELEHNGIAPAQGSAPLECPTPAQSNSCEVVDKVLYRSGDNVKLAATSYRYVPEMFLSESGNLLSDHNPLLVDFSWTL